MDVKLLLVAPVIDISLVYIRVAGPCRRFRGSSLVIMIETVSLVSIITEPDTEARSDPLSDIALNCWSEPVLETKVEILLSLIVVNTTGYTDEYIVKQTVGLIRTSNSLSLCAFNYLSVCICKSNYADGNSHKQFFNVHIMIIFRFIFHYQHLQI